MCSKGVSHRSRTREVRYCIRATPASFLMFTTAPDIPATTLTRQLAFIDTYLTKAGIPHNLTVTQDATYFDHCTVLWAPALRHLGGVSSDGVAADPAFRHR